LRRSEKKMKVLEKNAWNEKGYTQPYVRKITSKTTDNPTAVFTKTPKKMVDELMQFIIGIILTGGIGYALLMSNNIGFSIGGIFLIGIAISIGYKMLKKMEMI
jgi:hypothetical protein